MLYGILSSQRVNHNCLREVHSPFNTPSQFQKKETRWLALMHFYFIDTKLFVLLQVSPVSIPLLHKTDSKEKARRLSTKDIDTKAGEI